MQCFFTSWNSPNCHSRKKLNCQAHQDMKLMLDYKLIVTVKQFRLFLCAGGMRSSKTHNQP